MWTLFQKLFQRKTKWSFQKADLTENIGELKNPACGWYEIFPFQVEEKTDFKELACCISDQESLALVLLDIGAYREKELDNKALGNIRNILRFFAKNQYDVILRIAYDRHGKALEREPFFFKLVKKHLMQLMPLVQEFENIIFVYQGMLVGSWGEMHTSRFLAPAKVKEMWNIQKKCAGDQVYFAVRKPSQWRMLHPESCGRVELLYDQMGIFDDAIFGSENHLGTFGDVSKEAAGWEGHWKKADELDFEEILCKKVPNGGEAICGEHYPEKGTVANTVETLRKMQITYLNKAYDENIFRLWKQWKWEEPDLWQNVSLYDYIGRHLGYRFVIRDVEVALAENSKENVIVSVVIENVGFANCYQEIEVLLEWVASTGKQYTRKVACDLRACERGSVQRISCEIELVDSHLYLSAQRKKDGRRIFFANHKGERVLLGQIKDVRIRG